MLRGMLPTLDTVGQLVANKVVNCDVHKFSNEHLLVGGDWNMTGICFH